MYRFLSPLIVLVPQPFRLNSLRASLLTVLRVVYAIFRLSSGKTMVHHQLPVLYLSAANRKLHFAGKLG